ncbi:MAG: DinB family protein [Candidatus Solibacter usitatus]|nr:DinB family protein [Candidatus Solibacter usitatus]
MKPNLLILALAPVLVSGAVTPLESLHIFNKRNILEAANRVPEGDLDYRPTPEVRSFRELFGHIADAAYEICSAGKGQPDPKKGLEKAKLSRAGIVQALQNALAYCEPFEGLDAKGQALSVYHAGQHYGNLVTYMRLKGLTPPTAEGAPKPPATANPQMVTYYMGFLIRGPKSTSQATPETQRLQEEHLGYMRKMHEAGKLLVAGPFADGGQMRGMVIYKAASLEEAKAWAEGDPAVQAGRLTVEMHPWMTQKGVLRE